MIIQELEYLGSIIDKDGGNLEMLNIEQKKAITIEIKKERKWNWIGLTLQKKTTQWKKQFWIGILRVAETRNNV